MSDNPFAPALLIEERGPVRIVTINQPETLNAVNWPNGPTSWRRRRGVFHGLIEFRLPVVAAVNGPAVGLGCALAVLCDLVYVAESAYLADPHVSVGLTGGDGGAPFWPLTMSIVKAKELLFFGGRISAADAVALGLANG